MKIIRSGTYIEIFGCLFGRGSLGEGFGVGGSVWGVTSGTALDWANDWICSASGQRDIATAKGT
jgi:hypothetical protein